jgi:hypothetical protein
MPMLSFSCDSRSLAPTFAFVVADDGAAHLYRRTRETRGDGLRASSAQLSTRTARLSE